MHRTERVRQALQAMATFVSGRRTRYLTLLLWLALAVVLGGALPSATRMEAQNPANLPASAQSVVAGALQQAAFGGKGQTPGILVFYRKGGLSPQDTETVAAFLRTLAQRPLPEQIGKPVFAGIPAPALASLAKDKGSTLAVPLTFRGTGDAAKLAALLDALRNRLGHSFGQDLLARPLKGDVLVARFTGPMGIAADAAGLFKNADVTLLIGTTMLILVLLVLIYRSPILPFIPLLGVGFAYVLTSALLGALARWHLIVIDAETVSIMTVLMFGAGTDYTLLVVARYREHLTREKSHTVALREALAAAAGPVMMSAGTVMLALLALLLSLYGPEHRFAIPFALGVGMTALAALTLVPAILALLGRSAFYPFVPRPGVPAKARGGAVAQAVARRPWAVAIGATALLAVLAAFSPGIRTSYDLLSALPQSSQARQGADLLAKAYGAGSLSPVTVLVQGRGASRDLRSALAATHGVASVGAPRLARAHGQDVAAYQVTLRANPLSNAAMTALPTIRNAAEHALAGTKGTTVHIAGATAQNLDAANLVAHDTAVVIPVVLAAISLLLLLYLRSVVAAGYLIGTVLLSFFASIGLGWIVVHDLLGIGSFAGGVVLYAFVFLVALGEDYNIFMVSRIREERRHSPMQTAVAKGMRATGSVITAAGLILAGTFTVLTGLPLQILLEFGVVAAVGVLVDTFIVRSALVPALTALLGDRAFWPLHMAEPQDVEANLMQREV